MVNAHVKEGNDILIMALPGITRATKKKFREELPGQWRRLSHNKKMTYLYQQILYRPILNLFIFFYQTIAIPRSRVAIIFVTLFIRLILYPFFHTGAKQQMLMQRIQPQNKKNPGDAQKRSRPAGKSVDGTL